LDTHIQDLVNLLEFEDLTDVILIGHSYASAVIEGVAEKVPQHLRRLINLDGIFISNGRSSDSQPESEKSRLLTSRGEEGFNTRLLNNSFGDSPRKSPTAFLFTIRLYFLEPR
jgi:pimeloyl-ACP methyl ester carboxylesterase